ncbi:MULTISPECIES: lipid IV(A) 3-deoxy-D-manno-octulosonic acid transferase [unclassified Arsukibacterium]|uniref:lipid IV(A) 3-deoxy-D-manno-octulosonic acid transferase n=1 Tax=unclassified Arsukibacterium TaxID=2635278 RepID=UPI000C63F337|nr:MULTISPECIES: lipid IV(A) 3-deoxy-D-manno-octulosonic acid transferase [unclassified Arsukibacterium]MAA96378.1 3-deoxy-D-manno-octulosonic acid transferase [Rheinheimera sp.]MBM33111.1 3-deoxy-D-manno-octulosonic acid transferase [Rheinheimera sp.]|tara:strand:+ start:291 stop:2303 length:2013 start_codon:yes stop_codon:yes gene_type:complete
MVQALSRVAYQLLLYLGLLPLLGYLGWRSLRDVRYARRLAERFGWLSAKIHSGGIVVHAVSVGEVIAALPLIKQLQQQYPNQQLTVTCTTPTGSAVITSRLGDSVQHCYLPFDYPGAVGRFLQQLQPQLIVILETELWPNLLRQCHNTLIPTVLVNARLSARSAKGYRRFIWLTRPALQQVSLLLAQDNASARRFRALGHSNVQVTGNLKFEMHLPDSLQLSKETLAPALAGRLIWVAGSTHEGEDEQLLSLYPKLKRQFPDLLLVLVPRHPERFNKVATLATQAGLQLWRRSAGGVPTAGIEIALIDSMGELLGWYQQASLVFIGGSLIGRGGHNPLEAICFGKAVQTGPHYFNFADAYHQLAQRHAVSIVQNVDQLHANTVAMLSDPVLRQQQGELAQQFFQSQQGAVKRSSMAIAALCGDSLTYVRRQTAGNELYWFRTDLFDKISAAQFDPGWWQQQQAVTGSSTGRNTAWFVRHGHHHRQQQLVLRHYYRGGLAGKVNKDRFFYQSALYSRAMQEFSLLQWMRQQGLAVPRPVAARYQQAGLSYRADLLIERINDSRDLAYILHHERALTEQELQAVGAAIARLHDAGVDHTDLNCRNILLDSSGTIWLIDFDKCRRRLPGSWQQDNLQRLLRSFDKEQVKLSPFHWQADSWQNVIKGYLQPKSR